MRHTLAAYQGAILKRVATPRALDVAHMNREINNAAEEVYLKIRTARSDKLTTEARVDLQANIDLYPLPDGCQAGMVRGVERLDQGGTPVILHPIPWERQNHYKSQRVGVYMHGLAYTVEPGGMQIRLLETPGTTVVGGLRFWFIRKWQPMSDIEDEPVLPEPIHECVVPPSIVRISQSGDAALVNPGAFELYRQQMALMLEQYLGPDEIDRPNVLQDYDQFYGYGGG